MHRSFLYAIALALSVTLVIVYNHKTNGGIKNIFSSKPSQSKWMSEDPGWETMPKSPETPVKPQPPTSKPAQPKPVYPPYSPQPPICPPTKP